MGTQRRIPSRRRHAAGGLHPRLAGRRSADSYSTSTASATALPGHNRCEFILHDAIGDIVGCVGLRIVPSARAQTVKHLRCKSFAVCGVGVPGGYTAHNWCRQSTVSVASHGSTDRSHHTRINSRTGSSWDTWLPGMDSMSARRARQVPRRRYHKGFPLIAFLGRDCRLPPSRLTDPRRPTAVSPKRRLPFHCMPQRSKSQTAISNAELFSSFSLIVNFEKNVIDFFRFIGTRLYPLVRHTLPTILPCGTLTRCPPPGPTAPDALAAFFPAYMQRGAKRHWAFG